jgi:hypothetical protein
MEVENQVVIFANTPDELGIVTLGQDVPLGLRWTSWVRHVQVVVYQWQSIWICVPVGVKHTIV